MIAFICWKTQSFFRFPSASQPADHPWDVLCISFSTSQLKTFISIFFFPLLSLGFPDQRDEHRPFQLEGAVESVCFRRLRCWCSLCPLWDPLFVQCVSSPVPPHSQHDQGESRKWWVTFKHFHPFYWAADLFVWSSEVLIASEESSLAGCQEFFPRVIWIRYLELPGQRVPVVVGLVFLRTLLMYVGNLDLLDFSSFFFSRGHIHHNNLGSGEGLCLSDESAFMPLKFFTE